jgi:hypothetical protein
VEKFRNGTGSFNEISLLNIFLYLIIQAVLRIDYRNTFEAFLKVVIEKGDAFA